MKKKIALFGSGTGTNARNVILKLKHKFDFILVSNKPQNGFKNISEDFGIPLLNLNNSDLIDFKLTSVDLIVLVGFLIKLPKEFINNNPPIINLHPSLLPKYGGKGMWGDNVHKKILESGEFESGITIHYVNENYDEGEIIFQEKVKIDLHENLESLKQKIRECEMRNLPNIIESIL